MASVTLSGWPSGATVQAFARSTVPNVSRTGGTETSGAAITSGTASSAGTVTLSHAGLVENGSYIATDGSRSTNFKVPRSTPGATAQVTAGGNLGTAYTFDAASAPQAWLTGTLNGNVTVTLQGLAAGTIVRLFLTQDATGGRTVTVTDGGSSVAVPVSPAAGTLSVIDGFSVDGSTVNLAVR